ncbi:metalloregulator ArsR/SmtB family transcription factor [Sulfurimonas sp. MAG313]|nr:metalloregulator ArsR/SmtB family transcription factor [Sulfurimonas sp. MAG313]MDF1880072.1 metalloregulator ArsR/SmtB family transcription factor [Sulfurimonas sp. MAG313]
MKDLVQIAKIFSDSNRIRIITLIVREKEVCVCEICDTLELSQPLVSRHLKHMKEAGLLKVRQEGKWMIYTLTSKPTRFAQLWLDEIQKQNFALRALVRCTIK